MKSRILYIIIVFALVFAMGVDGATKEKASVELIQEANQTDNLLENHENILVLCQIYTEDGNIKEKLEFFICEDYVLSENQEGNVTLCEEMQEPFFFSESLLGYGEGEFVTITEEDEFLKLEQKKMEEASEYMMFTLDSTNYEIQKMEHWSPKQNGEMGKYADFWVKYDVEDYSSEEIICYEFLKEFYNVSLEETEEFFSEWEKEAVEIAAGVQNSNSTIVSYESAVLEELLEEKFWMLSDDAAEKMTMNRRILWSYQKSRESNADVELSKWEIEEVEKGKRYRYEVDLMIGTDQLKESGTIGIIREAGQCLVAVEGVN